MPESILSARELRRYRKQIMIPGTGEVLSGKVLLLNIAENSQYMLSVKSIPENHVIRQPSSTVKL